MVRVQVLQPRRHSVLQVDGASHSRSQACCAGTDCVFRCALLIAAACPVGTNVAVSAQLYGGDYTYAVRIVVMSTLLCVLTVPFLTYFASLVWA